MRARVRAELLRLVTQPAVWAFAITLTGAAAWSGRWSPRIVTLATHSGRPVLSVSIGGAVDVSCMHIATGLGVALAAVLVAAGPGRDFVDGGAELHRTRSRPAERLAGRIVAMTVPVVAAGAALACGYVLAGVGASVRHGLTLDLRLDGWDPSNILAAVVLAAGQATWVMVLAQRLRTQSEQVSLPIAITFALFLVSRLSPYPVTPDSWVGPVLGLRADRAMLDFWWSVGGEVPAPGGNVTILLLGLGVAASLGVRSDSAPTHPRSASPIRPVAHTPVDPGGG